MANKTDKKLKKLSKKISAAQEENAKLLRKLEKRIVEALERHTETNRLALEETRAYQDTLADGADQSRENGRETESSQGRHETEDHESGERDVTEAAARKAEEVGVDIEKVEGTGSGGRVLVKDVEATTQNEQ